MVQDTFTVHVTILNMVGKWQELFSTLILILSNMVGAGLMNAHKYLHIVSINIIMIKVKLMMVRDFYTLSNRIRNRRGGLLIKLFFMFLIVPKYNFMKRVIGYKFIDIMRCKRMDGDFGSLLRKISLLQGGLKMTQIDILFGRGRMINDY